MPLPHRRRRGQTLIEIVVVIALIGLLTTVTAVAVSTVYGHARADATRIQLDSADKALLAYAARAGRPPTTAEGLAAAAEYFPDGVVPVDAWGRPFAYAAPGPGRAPYVVTSLGADGVPGGSGDDADVSTGRAPAPP